MSTAVNVKSSCYSCNLCLCVSLLHGFMGVCTVVVMVVVIS
jgi:hypothetical protein